MQEITIGTNEAGQRLDKFLAKYMKLAPKSFFYKMMRKKNITLNGKKCEGGEMLAEGDTVKLFLADETIEKFSEIKVQKIQKEKKVQLSILYEDEDILAVNKPAQMPVHPSLNHYDHTLANAVCGYYNDQEIPYTFRCVNRLDRDTTGLTLIAKHMLSSAILSTAAARREISREYIAIASGKTPESGTIDAPIGRVAGSTIERQIDFENGERAITHYRRLAYHDGLSLLSLHLETGRTHQIRVHLKSIGHPLIGDFLYNPTDTTIKRQALHSYRLTFSHPITGESFVLTAPLPDDMHCLFPDFS